MEGDFIITVSAYWLVDYIGSVEFANIVTEYGWEFSVDSLY